MKAVYPFLSRQIERLPKKAGRIICSLAACCSDGGYGAVICRFGALRRTSGRKKKETGLSLKKLDEYFPDQFIEKRYEKSENSEINKTDKTKKNRNVPFGASGFC